MPMPHLYILECVITVFLRLSMIWMCESMYSLYVCMWNVQMMSSMMLSRLCSVITGGELSGLSLYRMQGQRKWSQAETLPVAHGKNRLAILLSKVASCSLCASIQSYDVINLMSQSHSSVRSAIWLEPQYFCSGNRSCIGIIPCRLIHNIINWKSDYLIIVNCLLNSNQQSKLVVKIILEQGYIIIPYLYTAFHLQCSHSYTHRWSCQ